MQKKFGPARHYVPLFEDDLMLGNKSTILFILFTCSVFFVSCNSKEFLKKFIPNEADQFARSYIDMLRKGDLQKAEKLLDPQFVSLETYSKLQEVANLLNQGELISIEVIDFNVSWFNDKKRNNLTYQLQFKDAWLLANVVIDNISGKQQIFGFGVKSIPKSLNEINALTLSGKTFLHYVILLFTISIPIFIIYIIVLCARTNIKRKWLWIIFILVGFVSLDLNWTSGQIKFIPISFQFFGASAYRSGFYGPWIISISFPLGAIMFIFKRHKIKKSESINVSIASEPNTEDDI